MTRSIGKSITKTVGEQFLSKPDNYEKFLRELKERIRSSQVKAALAVNQQLIFLYWAIGREILMRQQQEGWGTKVIDRIAKDLKQEFPDLTGFSARNLRYMKTFAESYSEEEILQRSVAKLPWRHNIALLDKLSSVEERLWYAEQALENGWSRDVLVLQIETRLYQRQGEAITNFERTLPYPDSELAQQLIKDPYNFDFLSLSREVQERDLEKALVEHIRDFLLELGVGFAFVGSQFPLTVDDREYRLDLLFYHIRLHCYVIIDLKIGEFEPEFSGKMNFYVSAVDNLLRTEGDNRSIGIVLCRSKRKTTVEFALQDLHKPIGVSTYRLKEDLPESLQGNFPTVAQLEMEMNTVLSSIKNLEKNQKEAD